MRGLVTFVPLTESNDNQSLSWDVNGRFQLNELKLMELTRAFNKNSR